MTLIFPNVNHKLRRSGEKLEIFDPVRKKYVLLTPEEEVRQCVLKMLLETLSVPIGLINVEKKMVYNGLTKRPDILVFNNQSKPLLLIECKAPQISLGKNVLFQASTYHKVLPSKYVLFTNGIEFQMFRYDESINTLVPLNFIPDFHQMSVGEVRY